MLPTILLSAIENGRLADWKWSRKGLPAQPVLEGACGLRVGGLHFEWEWIEDGLPHHLTLTQPPSGCAALDYDGHSTAARVTYKPHLSLRGLGLEVRVRPVGLEPIRFDARLKLR